VRNAVTQQINYLVNPTGINLEVRKGSPTAAPANYFYPLTSGVINGGASDTLTIVNIDLDVNTYYFKAWITTPIDNAPLDDTTRRTLSINPDIAITAIPTTSPGNCLPMNSLSTQVISITNKGNFDVEDIPVVMEVWDGSGLQQTISDTLRGVLQAQDYQNMTFTELYKVPKESSYTIYVIAELACDAYPSDNQNYIVECADLSDLAVVSILNPDTAQYDNVGSAIALKVRVENLSPTKTFNNIDINAHIFDGGANPVATLKETIINSIAAGNHIDYEFTATYTVPSVTEYTIKVFVDNVDNNPSNDTTTTTRNTDLGITKIDAMNFSLGQNIPNPAKDNTRIDYSIPQDGQVIFTVYTITGQTLHIEKQDASLGKNSIEFNTVNLANGIYYYSMEYKGEKLVKKMSIRK
jgi:hypothetical protein